MSAVPSPRIFLVDDEDVISKTAAAILRRSGFDVTSFMNPLESLAAASSEQPQLLISDIVMPELSGFDLAVQMQQVCPDCRILLVSGIAGTKNAILAGEALDYHFDILAKPLEPVLLIHAVRRKLSGCGSPRPS